MKQEIKLKVLGEPDREGKEGPAFLKLEVSNGQTRTELGIYAHPEDLENLGKRLSQFPNGLNEKVTFQLGEIDKAYAYYLLIEASCYSNGQSALKVIIDNHTNEPFHSRAAFFINTEPASINKLGHGLMKWKLLDKNEFEWIAKNYHD